VQCLDVVLPCEGCGSSALWSWLPRKGWSRDPHAVPADVDVLLVSMVCICMLCVAPPLIVYQRKRRIQRGTAHEQRIHASSYTVHVQGLPWFLDDSHEGELIKFLQETLDCRYPMEWHRYPERGAHHIVKVTFVFRLGRLIGLLSREKRSREMAARMKVIAEDLQEEESAELQRQSSESAGRTWSRWLVESLRSARVRYELRSARYREKWYERDRNRCLEHLGQEKKTLQITGAMVTFEHAVAAQRAVEAFRGGLCARRGGARPPRFQGHGLTVWPAPEPSDVIWQNFGEPETKVVLLRTLAALLLLSVMAVMCGVVYSLTRVKLTAALQQASSFVWRLVFRAMGPAIVFTDIALREVVAKGVELECPRSAAQAAVSAMWKHTAVAIFNSALACLLVHTETDEHARTCEVNWYLSGNLLDNAMAICTSNMLMTPFLLLFSPWGNNPVKSRLLLRFLDPKRSHKTQREVNEIASGVEYRLAYRYASTIKTIFVTLLFAPLAPTVVPAGLACLALQYWADKVCLLRTARRPPWQDTSLGQHAAFAIPLVLVPVPLLTVFLLRGTAVENLLAWARPCVAGVWDSEHHEPQRLGVQLYVLSPVIAMAVALCVYGGVATALKVLEFLWSAIRCCLVLAFEILRMLLYCLACGRLCRDRPDYERVSKRVTKFRSKSREDGSSMSYYIAQSFLPIKYHMANPVYTVLPEEVNPEIIDEPEPDDGDSRRTDGGPGETRHMSFRAALESLVAGCLSSEEDPEELVGRSFTIRRSDAGESEPAERRPTADGGPGGGCRLLRRPGEGGSVELAPLARAP